jgi:hypothetical protein
MSYINFDCPKCRQNLEAPGRLVALFVECPACGAVVRVPQAPAGRRVRAASSEAARVAGLEAEQKASTLRIDLPPDLGIPEPPRKRMIVIRRRTK